jgi:integrin-linked kinase-associated serine/threonine phosphatase 2C
MRQATDPAANSSMGSHQESELMSSTSTNSVRRIRTESKVDGNYKYSFAAVSQKALHLTIEFGVESVQGARKTMEDQHMARKGDEPLTPRGDGAQPVDVASGIPFFGVYDGHGGTQCAEFLRARLHVLVLGHPKVREEPEVALREAISKAEEEFMEKCRVEKLESGSTVAVAMILQDKLVVANVGDSEIVLSRGGKAELLTTKHHLSANESEGARIRAVGGRIFHSRVGHPKFNPCLVSLAVTRAIGDAGFKLEEYTDGKASGVIADPDIKSVDLTSEDNFLIIGCDGLWDVMKYQEAVDYVSERFNKENPTLISQAIVKEALDRGSTDNVTVLIVALQRTRPPSVDRTSGSGRSSSLAPTEPASTAPSNSDVQIG